MVHYYQRLTGALPGERVFWSGFYDSMLEELAAKNINATRKNIYDGIKSWPKIKLIEFGFEAFSYYELHNISLHLCTFVADEATDQLTAIIENAIATALQHTNREEWAAIERNTTYWCRLSEGFELRQFMYYLHGAIYRTPDQIYGLYLVYREAAQRMKLVEQLIPKLLWSIIRGEIDSEALLRPVDFLDRRVVEVFCSPGFVAHEFEYKAFLKAFNCAKAEAAINMGQALTRFLHGFLKALIDESEGEPCSNSEQNVDEAIYSGLTEVERTASRLVMQPL